MRRKFSEVILAEDSVLSKLLFHRLPKKFKRMVYISSVLGMIFNKDDIDMKLLSELNDIVDMARDLNSCQLPVMYRTAIWRKLDVRSLESSKGQPIVLNKILSEHMEADNFAVLANQFASNTPSWLNYSTKAVMINDITVVMKHLQRLLLGNPEHVRHSAMVAV